MRRARALAAALAVGAPLACATPAWERPPPPVVDAPVVEPGSLVRDELPNGLRVLVLRDDRLPRVDLGITVRRGEAALPPERAGLAVFTAELMKRGAGGRDALALAQAVDEIGASLSVQSGWDATSVRVSGLSRDFDRLLEVLADVALRPRFAPEEARKARAETLASLERARENPGTLAAWSGAALLYGEHRFGLPVAGTPETVAGFDAAAARALFEDLFVANDALLSAVGDVDPERFRARARELFGDWDGRPPLAPGPPPPEPTPPGRRIVIVDRPDLLQAQILMGHDGLARTDPDRIPAGVMNSILGGSGFSSRLTRRIRSDAGLAYGVGSYFDLRRRTGPFVVSTSTRVAEARRVVGLVLAELVGMREDPPDEERVAAARTLMVGSFVLGLETSTAVAESLIDLDVYGLPDDALDTYRRRVRAVSSEDVAGQARRLLHPERAAVVLVGPAAELRPQFEDLGPVEVRQP